MRRIKLDKIDRRILRDLQANGRMTNVDLAQRAGISAPPCLRRVRALEEAGFIRGYHADINPEALGFGVTVFAQVGLSSQAEPDLKAFETLVADLARGARGAHARRRDRFPAEDRRHRLGQLSALPHHQADGGAQCRACALRARHPPVQIRSRRADRR